MYSLLHEASAVSLEKYRLFEATLSEPSVAERRAPFSTAYGPGKYRQNAILQAWGVVTKL